MNGLQNVNDSSVESEYATDELLCDLQRTHKRNMPDLVDYQNKNPRRGGDPIATASGIALSGAYIYNSLNADNYDAVEAETNVLDVCLSHPSPFGAYHYHFWSPCINKGKGYFSQTESPPLCRDSKECRWNTAQFVLDSQNGDRLAIPEQNQPSWSDKRNFGGFVGLAKDGHVMVGPYNEEGNLWSCEEKDICNGAFIDGQYAYVSTTGFPYTLGCWGPGPQMTYKPTCTSNACGLGAITQFAFSSTVLALGLVIQ